MKEKQDEAYAPDETPDEVFVNSEIRAIDGVKLQPYSKMRAWAADAMGLRYGHVDKAGIALLNKTKVYPGAARDVGIVLWLCSLNGDNARQEIDEACRDPIGAAEQALEWAESHKIHTPKRAEFWDAYAIFLRIMREWHLSTGEPEKKTEAPLETTKAV